MNMDVICLIHEEKIIILEADLENYIMDLQT